MNHEKIEIATSKPKYVDRKAIEGSEVFVVIISKHWVGDTLRVQELEYAKSLHKPIVALILDGVDPSEYLKDADVLVKKECSRDSSEQCLCEITEIVRTELASQFEMNQVVTALAVVFIPVV